MSMQTYSTPRYRLDIEFDDWVGKITLTDLYSGVKFADSDYRYSAYVESGDHVIRLEGLYGPTVQEEVPDRGGKIVTISGYLGGPSGGVGLLVKHRIYVPEDGEYLEEQLVLRNSGKSNIVMRGYRFGFRKKLERPQKYGGSGIDIENFRMVALPFRLQPDGTKHDYLLDDIYHGRYQSSEFYNPARLVQEVVDKGRARSEGWAWTDGENGLLIVKYNPSSVEFSTLDTEKREDGVYLSFGGASASLYNEPVEARNVTAGGEVSFGQTRYHLYEGLWRRGAYMFRDYMAGLGHGLREDYSPTLNWSIEYGVGAVRNDSDSLAEHYNIEAIQREAKKAGEIGCESLFLSAGWESCGGDAIWDSDRLGDVRDFVKSMKQDYGLEVGLKAIGRSYCDDYMGMYRRRADGSVGYYAPYHDQPFYEPCFCCTRLQQAKLGRFLKVLEAGMTFASFDEFDWRGACYDANHGHAVPTTPNLHARAVNDLIRWVRERMPNMRVETHDPVWPWGVRYLPAYYLYDNGSTFDEIWGFDAARNALDGLLSGKALCLFYYNLAYEIPLHLNISMEHDNDNCLAFWWFASTVRHLGIGGIGADPKRFEAYRAAVAEYKSLRKLYTQGTFYGLDELTHIHVLADAGELVVNAFNLTDTAMSRKVEVRLNELGVFGEVTVEGAEYEAVGGKLVLHLEIPPFSPKIIKMKAKE